MVNELVSVTTFVLVVSFGSKIVAMIAVLLVVAVISELVTVITNSLHYIDSTILPHS